MGLHEIPYKGIERNVNAQVVANPSNLEIPYKGIESGNDPQLSSLKLPNAGSHIRE